MKSRNEVSAGGVVYRKGRDQYEVLICKDAGYHRWVLPKGLVNSGESFEQAATREVREETGVQARLVARLGEPEQYVYTVRGVRVFKSVHYFLLEYESGSIDDHDAEMEDVRWVTIETGLHMLAYDGAKNVLHRAKALLEQ
jgi:8-oxo-dGTP diphosphatase